MTTATALAQLRAAIRDDRADIDGAITEYVRALLAVTPRPLWAAALRVAATKSPDGVNE